MTSTTARTRRGTAPWWGLGVALALMALAMLVPAVTGWNVHVNNFPPLHADWDPRVGWGTAPAIVLAVLLAQRAVDLADRLEWRRLLLWVFVIGLLWLLVLAYVDGPDGVGKILGTQYEYLRTAERTTDLHASLQEFVTRIPYAAYPHNWPVHVAGHPPGALLFFVMLVRIGLGDAFQAGIVVTVMAATTAVAVLVTMRALGAERMARRAAPFVAFGPAAIWQAVSADAMFAAVAAWGMACLALAATRRSIVWSLLAGALLGYGVMLSYGLTLLGVLVVSVLVAARSWFPLLISAVAALAVVGTFALFGFNYLEALPAVHTRYFEAVGGRRPASYWMWGDLAALAFSAGPLAFAGVAQLVAGVRGHLRDAQTRVVLLLSGASVAMVALADISQMSRAEVERVWLPFVPWLLVSCALLPEQWRRRGIVVQLALAVVVQHLLATGW